LDLKFRQMKNIILLFFTVGLLCTSCETDPFINPGGGSGGSGGGSGGGGNSSVNIDCNKSSTLPAKTHCLSNGSIKAPCFFGDAELTGSWKYSNVTMTLNSNGSGTWKTSATSFTSASSEPLTWGVLLNPNGSKYGAANSTPSWMVIINNGTRSGLIDIQFAANGYVPSKKLFTNGWRR
jgi:hypothetical protein